MVAWLQEQGVAYQRQKVLRALELTPGRDVALDVGAHVGTWTVQLAPHFRRVVAFEPLWGNYWMANCRSRNGALHPCGLSDRAFLHRIALGEADCTATMRMGTDNTGDSYLSPDHADKTVTVRRYDSLGVEGPVSLVKVDVQGAERDVLRGMREMLERDHPTLVVEQKGKEGTAASEWAQDLGYRLRDIIARDHFLVWE
jgi:FkbM family methyltransferase